MRGGLDGDAFVFFGDDEPGGFDTIFDFSLAQDHVELSGFDGVSGFDDLQLADRHGGALVTVTETDQIWLRTVSVDNVSADLFEFV